MAYIHVAIARGSPCVVHSRDDMYWPSTNSQEQFRYVQGPWRGKQLPCCEELVVC